MRSILLSLFAVCLTNAAIAEDSFETVKNGTTYVCTAKSSNSAGSLSQLCRLAQNGNGSTIYHKNGKVFTYSAGSKGATWYYDNGNIITYSAGSKGSTWYYSNGKVLTYSSGTKGATWYHPNGNVMTYSAGTKGATWYYEDGQTMTFSGPEMSEEDLLYACDQIQ